jgi:uncharacterized metal-binding protein
MMEIKVLGPGCAVGCARAILANAQVPNPNYLVLTDLGIEKNKNFNLDAVEIQKVKETVKHMITSAV